MKISPYEAIYGNFYPPLFSEDDFFPITSTHQREPTMVHRIKYRSTLTTDTAQAVIQNTRRKFWSGFGLFYFLATTRQRIMQHDLETTIT
jgi:hypothetical protein